MNLENINVSLATLVKVGVPMLTAIIGGTGLVFGYKNHVNEEARRHAELSERMLGVECSLGVKKGYACLRLGVQYGSLAYPDVAAVSDAYPLDELSTDVAGEEISTDPE